MILCTSVVGALKSTVILVRIGYTADFFRVGLGLCVGLDQYEHTVIFCASNVAICKILFKRCMTSSQAQWVILHWFMLISVKKAGFLSNQIIDRSVLNFRLQCKYIYFKCKYIVAPYFVWRDESLHGNGGRSGTVTSGQSGWKRPKGGWPSEKLWFVKFSTLKYFWIE